MATITAKDVAALRAKTGIGMMECKKALVETDGNFEAAIKLLREKGELKAASKIATRIAADGIVAIMKEGDLTAMIGEENIFWSVDKALLGDKTAAK